MLCEAIKSGLAIHKACPRTTETDRKITSKLYKKKTTFAFIVYNKRSVSIAVFFNFCAALHFPCNDDDEIKNRKKK